MHDIEEKKENALKQFGEKLKREIELKKTTPKELSNICGISYTHIMNLINGHKSPTVEILLALQQGLKLSSQQIASMLLLPDTQIEVDEYKNYAIQYINLEERGSAKVDWIYEENLMRIADRDEDTDFFDRDNFHGSAIKYLAIYKLEPLLGKALLNKRMKSNVDDILKPNSRHDGPLKEIVSLLIDKDEETQVFIKDFVKLYIESHQA